MLRAVVPVLALALVAVGPFEQSGHAQVQQPYIPQMQAHGPIFGPDGKPLSGLDSVQPWSGSVEAGLNGTEGNTRILNIRAGADVKYESPEDVFTLNVFYGYSRQSNILSVNKALATARNEIPFDSVWAFYSQIQIEYDEFRAVDWRLALHSGISASAYRTEQFFVKVRAGVGASREIGGPNDRWIPEAQFGLDAEFKLTDRTKIVATGDYYPDIKNFGTYRVRARISLDTMLDPDLNMILRVGAQDRFDSEPGVGIKTNDLDYFLTLVFKF